MSALFKDKYLVGSQRHPDHDYSRPGLYFITVNTKNKSDVFGRIENGMMVLSDFGKVAEKCWKDIPDHFRYVRLDVFIIMPDHLHGIIHILQSSETTLQSGHGEPLHATAVLQMPSSDVNVKPLHATACLGKAAESNRKEHMSAISPKSGSVGTVVRSYKSAVSKLVHKNDPSFGWHSRYYDRIIRNEKALERIREYIINNPKNAEGD